MITPPQPQDRATTDDKTEGISEEELSLIMNRNVLFSATAKIPQEGKFYDIIQPAENTGGILGGMA